MEDLGIEAKEAAVREVAKILSMPEMLASITSIKSDYLARQQANDAQLSTLVAEQVEQARKGIGALTLSQKTIKQLRDNFVSIEKLCHECQTLIENHDKIKLLSNARNNLNTTLKDIAGMMSISVEAAAARDSLTNDRELIHTYERLSALDGKRRFALAAAKSHKEEAGRLRKISCYAVVCLFPVCILKTLIAPGRHLKKHCGVILLIFSDFQKKAHRHWYVL